MSRRRTACRARPCSSTRPGTRPAQPRERALVARLAPDPERGPGLPDVRPRSAVPRDRARRRALRCPRAADALVRERPDSARRAVLRDGTGRGPGAAGSHALPVRRQLGGRRHRRATPAARGLDCACARRAPRDPESRTETFSRARTDRRGRPHAAPSPRRRAVGLLPLGGRRRHRSAARARVQVARRQLARGRPDRPELGRLPRRQRAVPRLRAGRRARLGDGRARTARGRRRLAHLPAPLLPGPRRAARAPGAAADAAPRAGGRAVRRDVGLRAARPRLVHASTPRSATRS